MKFCFFILITIIDRKIVIIHLMKPRKILTYILCFVLSNKYFEIIIKYLELNIINDKVEILFYTKKWNKTSTFSFIILSSRHYMMILKYLFDRAKPRL